MLCEEIQQVRVILKEDLHSCTLIDH